MSKRKKHSPEFKREAIELARRSEASCRQIAQEIGVAPSPLSRWVREAQPGTEKTFPGTGSPRDEELATELQADLQAARHTRILWLESPRLCWPKATIDCAAGQFSRDL